MAMVSANGCGMCFLSNSVDESTRATRRLPVSMQRGVAPQAQFQSVPGLGRSSPDAVRVECLCVCGCTVVSCAKDA